MRVYSHKSSQHLYFALNSWRQLITQSRKSNCPYFASTTVALPSMMKKSPQTEATEPCCDFLRSVASLLFSVQLPCLPFPLSRHDSILSTAVCCVFVFSALLRFRLQKPCWVSFQKTYLLSWCVYPIPRPNRCPQIVVWHSCYSCPEIVWKFFILQKRAIHLPDAVPVLIFTHSGLVAVSLQFLIAVSDTVPCLPPLLTQTVCLSYLEWVWPSNFQEGIKKWSRPPSLPAT